MPLLHVSLRFSIETTVAVSVRVPLYVFHDDQLNSMVSNRYNQTLM